MGWRFVNPRLAKLYGVEAMPRTGENVAEDYKISRLDQDAFAARSQHRAVVATGNGFFSSEIIPVTVQGRKKGETKNGRASCRERVCQYVSISVVAVSLKSKRYNNKQKSNTYTTKQ